MISYEIDFHIMKIVNQEAPPFHFVKLDLQLYLKTHIELNLRHVIIM